MTETLLRFLQTAAPAALASWALVGLVRRYALRQQILDQPGPRASHTRPTPRGGGAGIVLVLLAVGLTAGRQEAGDWRLLPALLGIAIVAIIGWLDDQRSLGVGTRLAAHVVAATSVVPLAMTLPVESGLAMGLGLLWWTFWAVSAINVVNFMDGIDGLIGAQMVVFGVHLALQSGGRPLAVTFAAALSGSALGFLWWNWAPARIFLGDTGSGALGLTAVVGGVLALMGGGNLVTAFLPLYPIFLDATVTLVQRGVRGERLTEAHRSHLYQRLANGGWGHARTSACYAAAAAAAIPAAAVALEHRTIAVVTYLLLVSAAAIVLGRVARSPAGRAG